MEDQFRTDDFRFVHVTDCHLTGSGSFLSNLEETLQEICQMDPKPAFILNSGDMTEMGFREDYAQYLKAISRLDIPVYQVMGNHEVKWSNWGKTGIRKFLRRDPYYSFDFSGIHFAGLDSTIWLEHHGQIDRSQLKGLKEDLDKIGSDCPVILFFHHGPGYLSEEASLFQLLRNYNVRLMLVGHGHAFQTWKRNGIWLQMTQSTITDPPGYRILDISNGNILSYQKEVGKAPVADGVISLKAEKDPIHLNPINREFLDNQIALEAQIISRDSLNPKIEFGLDDNWTEVSRNSQNQYSYNWDVSGEGIHTASVRVTDPDGMQWEKSVHTSKDSEIWRFQAEGAIQRPVYADKDNLFFGTWGGFIYSLNPETGKQNWRQKIGSDCISQMTSLGNHIFLGATDGIIYSLDSKTGRFLWSYQTQGPIQGSPTVDQGLVFVGSGDHFFYALNEKTGKLVWKYRTEGFTQTKPICLRGTVYFGNWDQYFYALDEKSGCLKWKTPIGELIYFSPANSNPATDGEKLLVAVSPWHPGDPDLYCLDAETGNILWRRRNPGEFTHCAFNSPFVIGDKFYIASLKGEVFCLSVKDGAEIWRTDIGEDTYDDSPVVSKGRLFLGSLKGSLHCFDSENGKNLGRYRFGESFLFASPTLWQDEVIVPSMDGSVTAISVESFSRN